MHELLADICVEKAELALGKNNENLQHVLELFADVLETKLLNKNTPEKIKAALGGLNATCGEALLASFNSLSDLRRAKLTKLNQ